MRIDGRWETEADGGHRPMTRANVANRGGDSLETNFLLDSGADHTVLTAEVAEELLLEPVGIALHVTGVGGNVATQGVSVRLNLTTTAGQSVAINIQCLALSEPNPLGTCILGRDVLNLFTVIFDFKNRLVCLLAPNHSYTIQEPK